MDEIKKSQDKIKNLGKEICDLRSSLEFTENMLEEKVEKLEERCEDMETELLDPEYVYNKLVIDLEDRSRSCNLQIDGVAERKGEDEIKNIFKGNLQLENIDIEGAHH